MKTHLLSRTALASFLALVLMLSATLPSLAESGREAPLVAADFGSSQWQLLTVDVHADSRQAVLSILWKNTGAAPTSFEWSYDLFLTQGARRCQPIPLPPGDVGDDPGALVQPGGEQTVRLAFSLPDAQAEVRIRVDESFGQGYSPLSLTYAPAGGQVMDYTLPQPQDAAQPVVTPVPTPMPEPEPTLAPEPDPTPIPMIVNPNLTPTEVPPGEATAIPLPIPEGESPDIPMLFADFSSSVLKIVYVNVSQDSATAVLYLEWQNTGKNPTSFEWAYDLYVSQQGRRCQPIPLPGDAPSEDPEALVQPGGSQFISQAFALDAPQEDFQARIDESFGDGYSPLLFTYSPATRQLGEYTLPQPPGTVPQPTAAPLVEPLPTDTPQPLPTEELELLPTAIPEPLPTDVPEPLPTAVPEPTALTGESFLLDGRISFGLTTRRTMGLMGRMADYEGDGSLTYLDEEYATLPSDWTLFYDEEGNLNQIIVMFQSPAYEDPEGYVAEFDQIDTYLTGLAGVPDYNRVFSWTEGAVPNDSLSPAQAVVQGDQELMSWWPLEGMSITHLLGKTEDGLLHYIYFSK